MRALIKEQDAPGLVLRQVKTPIPQAGEVRIKIVKVGICGTDHHIYNWDAWAASTVPYPMVIGHEFVGRVDAVGTGVHGVKVGQRVSGEGHIVCGNCRNCRAGREQFCPHTQGVGVNRDGAFADYLVIPEHNVYPIPDAIPDTIAALLDPFGNAVHTALRFDLVGEDILITGAGPIGVMAVAICRHAGARHIVACDPNPRRLELAMTMGASATVNPTEQNLSHITNDLGMKEGFDIGLEMSGATSALNTMIQAMRYGGQIGLLGLFSGAVSIDLSKAIFKSLQMIGIYGREMFDTWHKGLAMLESGLDIAPVITHTIAIENFKTGFEALNKGEAMKVLMDVNGSEAG